MRFAIYGVGAIGGYFGGRLAQAGEDVSFIARGQHLQALRQKGLRVDSINGDFVVSPVTATDDPAQIGSVDVVVVAVKTWQVPEVAESIQPLLGGDRMWRGGKNFQFHRRSRAYPSFRRGPLHWLR
jgi:2-dehydropantoate 2-reductase